MKHFLLILLLLTSQVFASNLRLELPMRHLLVDEQAPLNIHSVNRLLTPTTKTIETKDYSLNYRGSTSYTTSSKGETLSVYHFTLVPKTAGKISVAPITFQTKNGNVESKTFDFQSYSLATFDSYKVKLGGKEYTYYSKQFTNKSESYVNELFHSEVKFLLPVDFPITQWNQPAPELDKSLAAWRYETPKYYGSRYGYQLSTSRYSVDESSYVGGSYTTTLHATAAGDITIGKFIGNLSIRQTTLTTFGHRLTNKRVPFEAKAITHTSLPLPANAPPSFNGDVGQFKLHTHKPAVSSLTTEDSLKLTLTLYGEGDFNSVNAPTLKPNKYWKLIDVTKNSLGEEERKNTSGEISFNYLLSPQTGATQTPIFEFSYFDPSSKSYQQLSSSSHPIQLNSNAATLAKSTITIPEDGEVQNDILGFIPVKNTKAPLSIPSLPFNWQWIPASLCLLLILLHFGYKVYTWTQRDDDAKLRKQQLKALSNKHSDSSSFYKDAGAYIENWARTAQDPDSEVAAILKKRDQLCYQPNDASDSTTPDKVIDRKEKSSVLKVLKNLCVIGLFALSLAPTESQAGTSDFLDLVEQQQYTQAIELLEAKDGLEPDEHYNLANCYYKTNQAGMAAFHYHKALQLAPKHKEATQNLKFLTAQLPEEEVEAIDSFKHGIAYFPETYYQFTLRLAAWMLLISLLTLFLFKSRSWKFTLSLIAVATLSVCLCILSFTATHLYPESIKFKPASELAVVVKPNQILRTEPLSHNDESIIVELTETSLCQVVSTRSTWSYIELPSGTRGWVKSSGVKALR